MSFCTMSRARSEATPRGVRYTILAISTWYTHTIIQIIQENTGFSLYSPWRQRTLPHTASAEDPQPRGDPAACPDPQQWPQPPVLHRYSVQYTQLHAQTHSNGHIHQSCTGTVYSKSSHAYLAHNIGTIQYTLQRSQTVTSTPYATSPAQVQY
jgi:hypothetical protein